MSAEIVASAVWGTGAITCGLLPWLYGRFARRAARRRPITDAQVALSDEQVAVMEHASLARRSVEEWGHEHVDCIFCKAQTQEERRQAANDAWTALQDTTLDLEQR